MLIVCDHRSAQSAQWVGGSRISPSGSWRLSTRPRLQYCVASFSTVALPVSAAHSSMPRPSVCPTESPTTRMRSGRCSAKRRYIGFFTGGGGGFGTCFGIATACNTLACALNGANTIVGAGTDAVTSTRAVTIAAAVSGMASRADHTRVGTSRAGTSIDRVPRRIGCSTNRNDAIASVSVSVTRSTRSGTAGRPVRAGVSQR